MVIRLLVVTVLLAFVAAFAGLAGCGQEGAAEKGGREIDDVFDQVIEEMEEGSEEAIERAKRALDDALEKARELEDAGA